MAVVSVWGATVDSGTGVNAFIWFVICITLTLLFICLACSSSPWLRCGRKSEEELWQMWLWVIYYYVSKHSLATLLVIFWNCSWLLFLAVLLPLFIALTLTLIYKSVIHQTVAFITGTFIQIQYYDIERCRLQHWKGKNSLSHMCQVMEDSYDIPFMEISLSLSFLYSVLVVSNFKTKKMTIKNFVFTKRFFISWLPK